MLASSSVPNVSTKSLCLTGLAVSTAFATSAVVAGQPAKAEKPKVSFVLVDKAKRLEYLAKATIWSDPGNLTPEALRAGPPLHDGSGVDAALNGKPFPCTFAEAGKKGSPAETPSGESRLYRYTYNQFTHAWISTAQAALWHKSRVAS